MSRAVVVALPNRYLSAPGHNPDVKLLLEAFQMALAAWGLRPEAAMLRAQMVARLLTAAASPFLAAWLAAQRAAAAVALPAAAEVQQQPWTDGPPPVVQCLVPATTSLTQAGGLHRMLLRGHTAPLNAMLLSPSGIDLVTGRPTSSAATSTLGMIAVAGCLFPILKIQLNHDFMSWINQQATRRVGCVSGTWSWGTAHACWPGTAAP